MEHMAEPASKMRNASVYALMVAGAVVGFYLVQQLGSSLRAPFQQGPTRFGEGGMGVQVDVLLHVLLALVVIIFSARLLGVIFRFLQQPPVIGEVLAGILLGPSLLGPSLLGRVAPGLSEFVLPPTVAPPGGLGAKGSCRSSRPVSREASEIRTTNSRRTLRRSRCAGNPDTSSS